MKRRPKKINIVNVVGARPNFIKIAPLMAEMRASNMIQPILIHTGQHYDGQMSESFFRDLDIPKPDISLGVGSGSHAWQTAEIMKRLEPYLVTEKADLVLVVGDVNSTLAGALTAVKLGIPVAHVEAGLRSFDRDMPEEINRIVVDSICHYHFVTERSAQVNLLREGISQSSIYFVGNVMIDTLLQHREKIAKSKILTELGLNGSYAVLTLHRPENVDEPEKLLQILETLYHVQRHVKLVFPAHPRTLERLRSLNLVGKAQAMPNLSLIPPLGYLDFLKLVSEAKLVLTDSGGVQEETTGLGVPCLTLRKTTERPVTVTHGTNTVVARDKELILKEVERTLNGGCRFAGPLPDLWDGRAAQRIVAILEDTVLKREPHLDFGSQESNLPKAKIIFS